MKAFNARKGKRYGRYDGIKAIIDRSIEEEGSGEFSDYDYYLESFKANSNYGQPLRVNSVKEYFGSYRKLWRIHHESAHRYGYFITDDADFGLVKKSDLQNVYFKEFISLKNGGVFCDYNCQWYTKKDFRRAMAIYNSQKLIRGVEAFRYIINEVRQGEKRIDLKYFSRSI